MHQHILITTLKGRRELLRISQADLAELAGIGLRTLKEIETGKGNPTLDTLNKLADVLGLELKLELKQSKH